MSAGVIAAAAVVDRAGAQTGRASTPTAGGDGDELFDALVTLVDDEEMTPMQRLMTCVDSASGVTAALDPGAWGFLNTELTVHVLRPPEGPWLCLDAETTLGPGSVINGLHEIWDIKHAENAYGFARTGQRTVVNGGQMCAAIGESSKPTSEMSSGTRRPIVRSQRNAGL